MSHPFEETENMRHSASDLIRRLSDVENHCCPNCRCTKIAVRQHQETYPKFDAENVRSTCDIYQCDACGTKWEVAYRFVHSMCILEK